MPRLRSKKIPPRRLTEAEIQEGNELDDLPIARPATRAECVGGPRPCPFVSCIHHLALEVSPGGSLKLSRPHVQVWEMKETCSLDVADRGPITLEEIGRMFGLTRERIRQTQESALVKIRLWREREDRDLEEAPERQGTPLAEAIG